MGRSLPPRETLASYLEEAARTGRGGFVLRRRLSARRRTFREIRDRAHRLGHVLAAHGLGPGAHVALWGASSPEWATAFLGSMLRGVVVVPLDDLAGPGFATEVARRTDVRLAFVGRGSADAARAAFGEGVPVVVLEELDALTAAQPSEPLEPVVLPPAHPLQVVFTSGTTAEPKGVVLSHRNVLANLRPIEAVYRRWNRRIAWLVRRRAIVSLLPLSHVFGQSVGIFVPLMMGLDAVFLETPSPSAVREALRRERALVLMAVPRFLAAIRRDVEADLEATGRLGRHRKRRSRLARSSLWRRLLAFASIRRRLGWRFVALIVGGSALPPAEEEAWRGWGYLVVQGYGLTETAPMVTLGNPFARGLGQVGRAVGDQEIRLADDGEILVRGGNVAEGYLVEGGLESLVDEEGWFHTGDLGELDAEGHLRIVGRRKDVIVTPEGLNVHPTDVEGELLQQAGVRECAVIGRATEAGDEVHAVLVLEAGAEEGTGDRAVAAANAALAGYQRIRSWSPWPGADLPRTEATGKVKRRDVRARLEAGDGASPEGRGTGVDDVLHDLLAGRTERGATLAELDLSSLDVVELVSRAEGRLGIEVDETTIRPDTTVEELARALAEPARRTAPAIPMPRWARTAPARLVGAALRATLAWPVMKTFAPLTVIGSSRAQAITGPVLIIANHLSYFDAPTVYRALPWRLTWRLGAAMATEPFDPLFTDGGSRWARAWQRGRYLLASISFNAFPLPRSAGFSRSLAYAGELIDLGRPVLVFPEGRMSLDGHLQPFRTGVGMLAAELGVPVLPLRIRGLHEVLPPDADWPRRGPVSVTIGEPQRFRSADDPVEVTRRLEEAVRQL